MASRSATNWLRSPMITKINTRPITIAATPIISPVFTMPSFLQAVDVGHHGFDLLQIRREQRWRIDGRIVLLPLPQVQQRLKRSGIGAKLTQLARDLALVPADLAAGQQNSMASQHTEGRNGIQH